MSLHISFLKSVIIYLIITHMAVSFHFTDSEKKKNLGV